MNAADTTAASWAVQVHGLDELIPGPSAAEARAACVLLNASFSRLADPAARARLHAEAVPWPHGSASHQADQHKFAELLASELRARR